MPSIPIASYTVRVARSTSSPLARITILGQVPFSDFDRMYDLLRNEAPLWLSYTYGSSSTTTKPLRFVSLESSDEPAGEGPEDADAVDRSFRAIVDLTTVDLPTSPDGDQLLKRLSTTRCASSSPLAVLGSWSTATSKRSPGHRSAAEPMTPPPTTTTSTRSTCPLLTVRP
ncbi:hypothetical protein [Sanguibacter antarcticus]|uniref:Uncharacterized protein n=1 Tax=Sanguibacter antarcticus TaxID=372484 RepID=A0A2A9E8D0_9MICO|nr:hypothetical protein [Sanguibacter antarcticus]PFG35093.1 hypothetical protein ATL42_3027 [Sanguibacter antarcticus]